MGGLYHSADETAVAKAARRRAADILPGVRRLLVLLLALSLPDVGVHAAPAKKKPGKLQRLVARLKNPVKAAPPAPAATVEKLGKAWQAYLDGDYVQAKRELQHLDISKLHNRDYALYLLAQSELLTGEPDEAKKHWKELSLLGGRFQAVARWRMADCDYAAGRLTEAEKAYEAVLGQASDQVEPAVARYRIAEALESRKLVPAALTAYRKVYVTEPLHPFAERALERLKALNAPAITAEEHIARAKIMTANRAWPRALDELALVPADGPPAVRDEADYWWATTKFKMRRDYDLAAEKLLAVWQRLPGDDRKAEALFHGARAQSRADKDDEAIAGYKQVVAKFPHSKYAAEASFLVGWLEFNRAHYGEAIPALAETLKRYGSTQWKDDAQWYLAYSRWLSGDAAGSLADFQRVSQFGGALTGGKGGYWMGRALDKLGRTPEAIAAWRNVVNTYPFSYYAAQARVRLKEKNTELGPYGDGGKGAAPPFNEVDASVAQDPLIARVDELNAAGMVVEAGVELKRGEGELVRRYGSAKALPILFDRYTRGDDFHRPHQLAESWSGGALKADPHADSVARKWWEQVYPRAYRSFIEKYAVTGDNPPYYLYTIMQKESAYNPHDVSYADAIGLLQMIPPTSRRVAEKIEFPYTDDVLYDPEGNIRFGAWYIGHLLSKFHKQIPLGAGSFNAGPRAMMKWLKANGTRPLDEFVELCPYTQTREYMKKVVEIYGRYVWLYEKEDYLPDEKIDPAPLDDGIDY
jgi:soluble lytic murein transglycosylase